MTAWRRLTQLPSRLNRRERLIALLLLVALIGIGSWRFSTWRSQQSKPAHGGSFIEGLVGQPQLLNPLVSLDANDRTVLSLLYPGLTRTSATGLTEPVLAESWSTQEEGKAWRFTLKDGLRWHDGEPLTTSDVAETVQRVVDPQQRSPYQDEWSAVTVEVLDARNLIFHLPQANASFLTATSLPIIPLHISTAELQQKLIGSGPYQYKRSTVKDNQVQTIDLVSNPNWPDGEPYIANFQFKYFDTIETATRGYQAGDITGLLLENESSLIGNHRSFKIQRMRALFANTSRPVVSDASVRQTLLSGKKASDQTVTLILPEGLKDYAPLVTLTKAWTEAGQSVTVTPLDSKTLLDRIDAHDYDLLLAEVDLRADFDLYPLWHSTQRDGGLNLSQLDDKQIDGWLEQARAAADPAARKQLADQISARATEIGAWAPLEQLQRHWYVQSFIQGLDLPDQLVTTEDRLTTVSRWYAKTKVF